MIERKYEKISNIIKNKKNILNEIRKDKSYNYFIKKMTIFTNKQKEIKEELSNSELFKTYYILNEERNKIKNENESLARSYNVIKKLYRQDVENIFFNLINDYKNKKYNISESFLKKNFFRKTPLLLKEKELDFYYLNNKFRNLDKHLFQNQRKKHILFLNKENESLLKSKSVLEEKKLIINRNESNKCNNLKIKKVLSAPNLDENNTIKNININIKNINIKNNGNINVNNNKEINIYKEENKNIFPKEKVRETNSNIIKRLSKINIKKNKTNIYRKNELSLFSEKNIFEKRKILSHKLSMRPNQKVFNLSLKNYNSKNANSQNAQNDKHSNDLSSQKRSSLSEPNKKDLVMRSRIYKINVNKLKKHSNNKELIEELLNIKNQSKFLQKMQKINIEFFTQKELEEIIEYYCRTFLKFSEQKLNNVMTPKTYNIDIEILNLIDTFISKNNRIKNNRNIKKENNLLSYKILKSIENKAFLLQKTLLKNQAIED